MDERLFDIYVRYSVKAKDADHALDLWDDGKAAFQEFEDVVEVPGFDREERE